MALLTAREVNQLPDSDFAYIEPGGMKDSTGRTVPRSLRHFPIHDAAHVRNALARAPQSRFGKQAMPKILAAAKRFGVNVGGRAADEVGDVGIERRYVGTSALASYESEGAIEVRAAEDGKPPRIVGYASVFDSASRNLGGFVEQIAPSAFNRAHNDGWPGAVARYNHDPNMLLGTVAARTLELSIDRVGLWYDVVPPAARGDIVELVQRGDVRHSSFAFRVAGDGEEWTLDEGSVPQRRVHDVELVDVAPVVNPAYPDATAGYRSLARQFDADPDEVRSMVEAGEAAKLFARPARGTVIDFGAMRRGITSPARALGTLLSQRRSWDEADDRLAKLDRRREDPQEKFDRQMRRVNGLD